MVARGYSCRTSMREWYLTDTSPLSAVTFSTDRACDLHPGGGAAVLPALRSTPRFVARPLHPPSPPSADSSRCRSRRRCPRARPACPSLARPPPPSAPTSRTKCMQTVCADAIDLQQTQRLVHIELLKWRGGSTQRGSESRMRGRGLPGVPMRLSTWWVNVAGWCSGRGIELTVEGWACRQHRATRYASIATLLPRAPRVFAAGRPRERASANPD